MTHLAEGATREEKGHVQVGANINVASGVISVPNATIAVKGVAQLNNTVTSASTTQGATANAVKTAMDRANAAFTSADNGKTSIKDAIIGVDDSVVIPTNPSFQDLASGIGQISTGKKWASGVIQGSHSYGVTINVTNDLPFTPTVVIVNYKFRSSQVSSDAFVYNQIDGVWKYLKIDGNTVYISISNVLSNGSFTLNTLKKAYDYYTEISWIVFE